MRHTATYHIGIVGAGPRGVVLFGEIGSAFRKGGQGRHLKIHLIDPNPPGIGCHPDTTPDYLVTNTLAGDCTAFGVDTGFDTTTALSFTAWAAAQGYRWVDGRVSEVGSTNGRAISALDHIPRRLLGLYFNWCWRAMSRACPVGLSAVHHRDVAIAVAKTAQGYQITMRGQRKLNVDALVLSTGHTVSPKNDRTTRLDGFVHDHRNAAKPPGVIDEVYPVRQLDRVAAGETVIVEGLGLTAMDAVVAMTIGRGGVFDTDHGVYDPSGQEPRILVYTRSGAPPLARNTPKERGIPPYDPKVFTVEAIRALRTGAGSLDFQQQVLPLLKSEMALAIAAGGIDPAQASASVDAFFAPFSDRAFGTLDDYCGQMQAFLRTDQEAAGKLVPERAGLIAVRACYPAICAAVEHRGLTAQSHVWYARNFLPFLTRAVFSVPLFRARQLSALIASGTVQFAGGPGAFLHCSHERASFDIVTRFRNEISVRSAKTLVVGRLPKFAPACETSPLVKSLMGTGLARAAKTDGVALGGFDVTSDDSLIGADGQAADNIWIVGYQSEGLNLFKHALPRNDRPSHHVFDRAADIAVKLLQEPVCV